MFVPCRKCETCLQFRQMKWRERAIREMELSACMFRSTWFGTLTFSPVHLAGVLLEARSPSEGDVERSAYTHVQRYLKRLRKCGASFRYLAVFERGEKTGRAHYHLLLHEASDQVITDVELDSQWRSFTNWRMIDGVAGGAATYVTKYTTKSLNIRPRASTRYGQLIIPPKSPILGVDNSLISGEKMTTPQQ